MFLSPTWSTSEPFSPAALAERESQAAREQLRQKWESLRLELKTKLQLLQKTLEQDLKQPVQTLLLIAKSKSKVHWHCCWRYFSSKGLLLTARCCCFLQVYSRASRVTTAGSLFKGETEAGKSSLNTLYDSFRQTMEDMPTQVLLFL